MVTCSCNRFWNTRITMCNQTDSSETLRIIQTPRSSISRFLVLIKNYRIRLISSGDRLPTRTNSKCLIPRIWSSRRLAFTLIIKIRSPEVPRVLDQWERLKPPMSDHMESLSIIMIKSWRETRWPIKPATISISSKPQRKGSVTLPPPWTWERLLIWCHIPPVRAKITPRILCFIQKFRLRMYRRNQHLTLS